jgi:hypothetical protein
MYFVIKSDSEKTGRRKRTKIRGEKGREIKRLEMGEENE